jgi:hypothetical protein
LRFKAKGSGLKAESGKDRRSEGERLGLLGKETFTMVKVQLTAENAELAETF